MARGIISLALHADSDGTIALTLTIKEMTTECEFGPRSVQRAIAELIHLNVIRELDDGSILIPSIIGIDQR